MSKIVRCKQKVANGKPYERSYVNLPKEHAYQIEGEVTFDSVQGAIIIVQRDKYDFKKVYKALEALK